MKPVFQFILACSSTCSSTCSSISALLSKSVPVFQLFRLRAYGEKPKLKILNIEKYMKVLEHTGTLEHRTGEM